MRIALISLTEKGRLLSAAVKEKMPSFDTVRYCWHTHTDSAAEAFDDLGAAVRGLWESTDALVFVCACGIAVRCTAPLLRSKLTDPAVIVMDNAGKYVIPVLSGHTGGANALAGVLAERTGAVPVITTATDTGGLFSPDCFAAANGLIIKDHQAAKHIAAAVLDGGLIGLECGFETAGLPEGIVTGGEARGCTYGMYIGADPDIKPFPVTLSLLPKNIVLGIGCKKGTPAAVIAGTVRKALSGAGIAPERVCAAASVDIKRGEEGLLAFCRETGAEACFYTAEQLAAVPGDFAKSEFVRSVTGVDNVCERSAVLCSGGKLVMHRFAENGVTAAAAEKPLVIDFGRKML